MTYKVIVRPEAAREIQEAFDWYEGRSEGLGFEFLRVADACLSGGQLNPTVYQVVHEQVRRALLRKFPTRSSLSSRKKQSLFWRAFMLSVVRLIGSGALVK